MLKRPHQTFVGANAFKIHDLSDKESGFLLLTQCFPLLFNHGHGFFIILDRPAIILLPFVPLAQPGIIGKQKVSITTLQVALQ